MSGKVYFIGAGPGDPELLTIKGKRLLEQADVVIYTGSLINPQIIANLKAQTYNSAYMNLEEIVKIIKDAYSTGKTVVRLHTGDPSIYSAISEQINELKKAEITYEIVPGISSAMAGAAMLGCELTAPEISQTVILTRIAGKTPVPERESLKELARHQTTMVMFLSIGLVENVKAELLCSYGEDTPFAVIEKATWPEQRIIRGKLKDLDRLVAEAGIKKTALIYVGDALSHDFPEKRSKLYDKDFQHEYRR